MTVKGYASVSTDGQPLQAQREALGRQEQRRYSLRSNQALDLLNTLDTIAKAGAAFRLLGDPRADTTAPYGKPMITALG